jgi:DNA-binding XRE family transcriptional regulator
MNEVRQDLYTQSEYAKKIGVTRARVNQMIKEKLLKVVIIKGATLIKVG